jgi:hypothetical protein
MSTCLTCRSGRVLCYRAWGTERNAHSYVTFALRFVDERLIVQAAYDDLPLQTLGEGVFTVQEDGSLHYIEVIDGVQHTCEVMAAATIDGARLRLEVDDLRGCDADGRMANTLFFRAASYSRTDELGRRKPHWSGHVGRLRRVAGAALRRFGVREARLGLVRHERFGRFGARWIPPAPEPERCQASVHRSARSAGIC